MPFVDVSALKVVERLPGWFGRHFHSDTMTFGHYEFTAGSFIHEHFHPEEEVWTLIEGDVEMSIDGVSRVGRPGMVGVVPADVKHAVRALTDGRAIVVAHPPRRDFG